MRLLLPVSLCLFLGLAGCASSPKAPPNNPLPAVPPPVETSVISMPVTVDLEQLRVELLRQLPSPVLAGSQSQVLRVSLNPAGRNTPLEPGTCSVTELNCLTKKAARAIAVDYTAPVETVISHQVFVRDLAMSMTGNQFTVTARIEFSVSTRFKSSIAQFGVASCGVNEAMPRLDFTLSGYVNRGPTGDLVITPKPYAVKWLRPCNITAFNLNVESLLNLPVLREKLQESLQDAVFSGLHQVSVRTQLAKAWPELNAPREIQPGVWLLPHPTSVAFADIVGNGRYVSTGVLVRAHPEVVTGPRPVLVVPPVPVPEHGISGDSMHLAIRGDIALREAEALLNQKLAKKPMTVNGRVVQVEAIRLYGSEDKAVLGLTLSQPVQAEIFLLGKPVFDVEKNEVHFDSLSYSLGSRDFLVKSANWLLGSSFRDTLQQKARFRFDDDLAEALKDFRDYQQEVGQGFVLKAGVTRVRPQALYFTQERLLAYVIVDGHLSLQLGK
ncbi:MAG: DUF4403 family protein [bacterium]|nr:DUF4403 family protein [bacterium]